MVSVLAVGVLIGRPRSTASILSGAVLVLLVLDPWLVWAVGFQLSVAATAGILAVRSLAARPRSPRALLPALPRIAPKEAAIEKFGRTYTVIVGILAAFFFVVTLIAAGEPAPTLSTKSAAVLSVTASVGDVFVTTTV